MYHIEEDKEYIGIVKTILYNDKFNEIKKIEHHGVSRYDHSVRVSYYSYKISKFLKLDYKSVARAGLLHDYFLSSCDRNLKERVISTFIHPKKAVTNSKEQFGINKMEENIIGSHMFPVNIIIPCYAESWIVNFVDKMVASFEFTQKFSYRFSYAMNLLLLFLINSGK